MSTVGDMVTNLNRRGMPDDYNTYAIKWIDQAEEIMWNAYDWKIKFEAPVSLTLAAASATYATTGIATDIEDIPYMYDSTNNIKLTPKKLWEITEVDPDLSSAGRPYHFYYTDQDTKINFWPEPDAATTLKIPYWKQRTVLTATTNTPAFATRYHGIIEDGAWALFLTYEFGEEDSKAIMAWNTFRYGDPTWRRGKKITGGYVGAFERENRFQNEGYSQNPGTGVIK